MGYPNSGRCLFRWPAWLRASIVGVEPTSKSRVATQVPTEVRMLEIKMIERKLSAQDQPWSFSPLKETQHPIALELQQRILPSLQ